MSGGKRGESEYQDYSDQEPFDIGPAPCQLGKKTSDRAGFKVGVAAYGKLT